MPISFLGCMAPVLPGAAVFSYGFCVNRDFLGVRISADVGIPSDLFVQSVTSLVVLRQKGREHAQSSQNNQIE